MSSLRVKTVMIMCAAAVALAGCAPSLKGIRTDEVRQSGTKVIFGYGQAATYEALLQACVDLSYTVDSVDRERQLITGTTPASLLADSEHFAIHVTAGTATTSEAYFASVLLFKSQLLGAPKSARQGLVRQAIRVLGQWRDAQRKAP